MFSDTQLLHLSLIPQVGPGVIQTLRTGCVQHPQIAEHLYSLSASDFMRYARVSERMAPIIVTGLADTRLLEEELKLIAQHRIEVMTVNDARYPRLLKEITTPPAVLYMQGASLQAEEDMLAVIGSRAAGEYAARVVQMLVPELVEHGWTIVSGGALGADTMAHQATLAAGGRTVAIVGSGLLVPYPASNKKLFDQIVASGGTMVSPFPLRMQSLPQNFPARNRIISGLSRGCIVVQAAEKSGASITAHCALDQGREVFAIPGLIDDPLSVGCHRLIQEGARLVTHVTDIFDELGQTYRGASAAADRHSAAQQVLWATAPSAEEPLRRESVVKQTPRGVDSPKARPTVHMEGALPVQVCLDGFEPCERAIVMACTGPSSVDGLAQELDLPIPEVQAALFNLQLEGVVEQNFAGLWQRR